MCTLKAMAEFPALAGLLVPGGETAGGPDSFPPEIEEEANNNFQVSCMRTQAPNNAS